MVGGVGVQGVCWVVCVAWWELGTTNNSWWVAGVVKACVGGSGSWGRPATHGAWRVGVCSCSNGRPRSVLALYGKSAYNQAAGKSGGKRTQGWFRRELHTVLPTCTCSWDPAAAHAPVLAVTDRSLSPPQVGERGAGVQRVVPCHRGVRHDVEVPPGTEMPYDNAPAPMICRTVMPAQQALYGRTSIAGYMMRAVAVLGTSLYASTP